MLHSVIARSRQSALAGSCAFAYAAVVATTRTSRWFDMQAGAVKYSKNFTKRPAKGLLALTT
jgi:hypothetical protein